MLQKYLRFLEKNQLLQHETTQVITLDKFTYKNFIQGLFDNEIQWSLGQGLTTSLSNDHGVTETHGMVAVAVHQYHVEKEHHVGRCNDGIAVIKHGPSIQLGEKVVPREYPVALSR